MAVKEINVNDLKIGDQMVFTRSGSENRDIVDDILDYLVEKHLIPDGEIQEYRLSLLWKQALIDLSIKKLTRGAPSVAAKLASIKAAVPGTKAVVPGGTVNAGDSATPESDEDKSA